MDKEKKETIEILSNLSRLAKGVQKKSPAEESQSAPSGFSKLKRVSKEEKKDVLPKKRRVLGTATGSSIRRGRQKGKKVKKLVRSNQEQKYSLEEIAHNKELVKKILMKSQTEHGEPHVVTGQMDDLDNLTKENLLPRERNPSMGAKKNPLNRKEKHNREVQALLLMDAILERTSRFTAKEKIVDFARIAESIANLQLNARDCKRFWKKLKEKIKNSSMKKENDYYKDLRLELEMKNYGAHFKKDLEDRVKMYERQLDTCVTPTNLQYNTQKEFMIDLMHDYACLTSSGEKNKREYLRHLESKFSEGPAGGQLAEVDLDEETVNQIHKALEKAREERFLERQKLVSESAFTHPWTDVETLSLLRGVAKYGEHSWSDICDKYSFQSFRTPNSLAYKWSKLKSAMLEDIQKIHAAKGITISKWDWIQCCIHKLEVKCGYFTPRQPVQPLVRFTHIPKQPWVQRGYPSPMPQGRVIGTPIERINGTPRADLVQAEIKAKESFHQEPLVQDKKQNALQQLCDNYAECINRFKGVIETGDFNLDDVRKYITSKEATPVYPKYFELHYAPRPSMVPPKVDEVAKRPIFKLHPKEEPLEQGKTVQQPVLTKPSVEPELKKAVSVPVTTEERNQVEPKKSPQPMNLKKLFLQKKKAQLSSGSSVVVAKEEVMPPSESQKPLNN